MTGNDPTLGADFVELVDLVELEGNGEGDVVEHVVVDFDVGGDETVELVGIVEHVELDSV